jgi:hypothetical protein
MNSKSSLFTVCAQIKPKFRIYTHTHTHTHTHTLSLSRTHARSHIHTHANTYIHIHSLARAYTHTLSLSHTRKHTHTVSHARTHARTHTSVTPVGNVTGWSVISYIHFYTISGLESENKAAGIRHADHVAPSIRKRWHELSRQAAIVRSV